MVEKINYSLILCQQWSIFIVGWNVVANIFKILYFILTVVRQVLCFVSFKLLVKATSSTLLRLAVRATKIVGAPIFTVIEFHSSTFNLRFIFFTHLFTLKMLSNDNTMVHSFLLLILRKVFLFVESSSYCRSRSLIILNLLTITVPL